MVRRHLTCAALLFAGTVGAQPANSDGRDSPQMDCGSVVVVKCDRAVRAVPSSGSATARQIEQRRVSPLIQQLDGVVIEGDAIRRRTVEDVIGGAFPAARPRDGDTTFSTGEGKQCTCLNLCPPWPLPCCNCSSHMNRYINMPGSSPLN